jgi:hypothetical protein
MVGNEHEVAALRDTGGEDEGLAGLEDVRREAADRSCRLVRR